MAEENKIIKIVLIVLTTLMLGEALYLLALLKGESFQKKNIAIIDIKGPILDSEEVLEQINEYKDNPTIASIVLRIDSPGGYTGATQEIYQEIKEAREEGKIFVTSFANIGASGAYYIAAATNYILANPGTLTGSIGVIMEVHNFRELLNKLGLKAEIIKSGKYKDIGSPLRDMTSHEKELIQQLTDDVHCQFIEAVSKGRKIKKEKLINIADGRILTGLQAYKAGLVDQLGNLNEAIKVAARLANIEKKPTIIRKKAKFSQAFEELFNKLFLDKITSFKYRARY
ncbi:signal peptide peptidase SppA [bacterium]|nr:signal peptide peptidase SppA [bacterium]MBU0899508.1 signal peptide peptidase SppA [bacterium]MBU1153456.1 signal peptide peptidase SppA [bacterium]MBU2599690.1 signal peptide peptidase SppA [bacterium]